MIRPRRRIALCLGAGVVAASAGWAPSTARAAGLLINDDRLIDVDAQYNEGGGSGGNNLAPVSPIDWAAFNQTLDTTLQESLPFNRSESQAIASQTSSFDASPDFLSTVATGYSRAYAKINSFTGVNTADADSDSVFLIRFSISTPHPWSISAAITDDGTGSTGRVRLYPVGEADIFTLQGSGAFSDTDGGVLLAGTYELIGEARNAIFVTTDGGATFGDRESSFELDFRLVPEPTTGVLALLGIFAMARRTRGKAARA